MNVSGLPRRYYTVADALGGELCTVSGGSFLKIVSDFHGEHRCGDKSIRELDSSKLRHELFTNDYNTGAISPDSLLFFDMETTGLGGSGTVPFLIGFGSLTADGFQVRQYFLPDYPDESAMLEEARAEIKNDTVLVSYNGKAFDLPILTDRLILQRIERNLTFDAHIDLLHSVRRLFKRRLGDCSLSNIEREVLGFFRYDDLPGYLVPSVYFNWLSTEDPTDLKRVIRHNIDDIVSLYFLIDYIAEVRLNPMAAGLEPDDIFSLARILERRGEFLNLCDLISGYDQMIRTRGRFDLLFFQSISYKRAGHLEKAVTLWNDIAARGIPESFYARVELAKFYEHRARDFKTALNISLLAQSDCPETRYIHEELERRIRRLEKKCES